MAQSVAIEARRSMGRVRTGLGRWMREGHWRRYMLAATRRTVLQHVAGAAIAGVGYLTGPQQVAAQTAVPRLRSEASTAAGGTNLVIYRNAISYMRSLPNTDRRSWAYQVSIH